MKKIIEKVKSQIPKYYSGFSFRKSQDLYIPYMEIGIECLIRDISEINLYFETILKLIEIEVKDVHEISNILGVSFEITKEAVVDMVEDDYVSVSENTLRITKKGKEALKTKQVVEIKKKNINKVMVDLITGEIYDGTNMRGCRISKSDVCLDKQINISKAFLDSNYSAVNQVFQQQQENDSIFGRIAITKELYKIVDISYENLVYIKNEVLVYENDNSDDVQLQLQNDINDQYLNCLYAQLREGIHPCLESFFEKDYNFITEHTNTSTALDEGLCNITDKLTADLRYAEDVDNIDFESFIKKRYMVIDKEYINYFIYSDEVPFDKLIIITNRVKNIVISEIFQELKRIAAKRTVVLIYDKNEFNATSTINHFLSSEKNNKNLFIISGENIKNTTIFFAPFLEINIEEQMIKAFNRTITYKFGVLDFDISYEKDSLKNILATYNVEALIQKRRDDNDQNRKKKKENNRKKS